MSRAPEAELLLCCARTRMDSERAARIEALLREDPDWDRLLRTALQHGAMPLLYRHLKALCPEAVPAATLNQLRDYFHVTARHNLLRTGELTRLLNLLQAHQIQALAYKGPILARSVYGNLSLRQFTDLDIMVHKKDVPKARDLLRSQGYQSGFEWSVAEEAAYRECQLVGGDSGVIVELQWGVTPRYFPFLLDLERLWGRLEPLSFAGTTINNIPPEDLLLILCVHGSKHCWQRLLWICDVAELIRAHPGMDWERVMERAGSLGVRRAVLLGLHLANDLLGTPLPVEVLQRVRADRAATSLAVRVHEWLFRQTDNPLGFLESSLFHLKVRERLYDRILYCLHRTHLALLPTAEDRAFLPLPAFLSFLYYLLRPIRLVREYGLSLSKYPGHV